MKAIVFDTFGEPAEVLHQRDVPEPPLPSGSVRVRMRLSPVNPSDLMTIRGEYGYKPALPATPGFEGVGQIEALTGGLIARLRRLKVGQRVAVLNGTGGNWAEQVVVSARQVVPLPDDLPDEQAAGFFVNPATALVMTRRVLQVPRGEWLLQSAATGALGRMVIRLGKHFGFRTVNLVRDARAVDELKALGAHAVVVGCDTAAGKQVRSITDGGVRFALDPVGGDVGTTVLSCLTHQGRLLLYGSLTGDPIRLSPRGMLTTGARVEGFWLKHWAERQGPVTMLGLFREITNLMRAGVLTAPIAATYSLAEAAQAVRHAEQAGRGGKVLLRCSASTASSH